MAAARDAGRIRDEHRNHAATVRLLAGAAVHMGYVRSSTFSLSGLFSVALYALPIADITFRQMPHHATGACVEARKAALGGRFSFDNELGVR